MTSRRKFLKQGTLGALAAGFTLGVGENTTGRSPWTGSANILGLNRAAFASQLHTTFLVKDRSQTVPLELTEVISRGSKRTLSGEREAFTLVFRGAKSTSLSQETYSIEHTKLGAFTLLVVPVSPRNSKSNFYEINVNRLHG